MFDDHDRRIVELRDGLIGGIRIVDVVIAQFFALKLCCGGDTGARIAGYIERRRLMRVLAIAQALLQCSGEGGRARCVIAQCLCIPAGNGCIIPSGARVGFCGKSFTIFVCEATRECAEDGIVILDFRHNGAMLPILRPGSNHRRAANIDVLNACLKIRATRNGGFERIEIDDQQVDCANAVRFQRGRVVWIVPQRQQPAMYGWMQRFYATIHHLREACELRNIPDWHSRF